MRPFSLDTTDPRFSSQFSTTSTTRSTKFPSELRNPHYPPFILCRASKRRSPSAGVGLQRKTQKDLSRILRTESAIKEIERKANSKKYNNLWPKAVLEALDEAIRENRHESALKIFSLLRKQHWYEPRCQTYTKLLMMLGKCRQPEQAGLLFELMLTEGLKPTLDVYTALVSAYGHSGRIDEALSTLEAMKSVSDCRPDVYTYSILINCCTKFYQFDLIEQILSEMSYLGISCSTVTYNTMVDGYGKAEMFEQMEKSLMDMIDSGSCLPDVFTLNSVVGAYGKSGQIDKMERWYEDFQLMGIRPDIVTFNTMIRSYGKAGLYEKMSSVFYYMEKRFFSLTTTTYNVIIDIYGKAGNVEKMEDYFKKMKHQGMKPTSVTYCSLVSAYSKSGLIMKVDSILRQVDNSDVVLDTPFFNSVISAYGQVGDIEKMRELFLLMKERKCSPDTITYATMIQTYNALGMTEVAEDLENNIIRTEDQPGSLMSSTIVTVCLFASLYSSFMFITKPHVMFNFLHWMGSFHTSYFRVSERLFCIVLYTPLVNITCLLKPCMFTSYLLLGVVILTDNKKNTDADSIYTDNPDQADKVALIRYSQQADSVVESLCYVGPHSLLSENETMLMNLDLQHEILKLHVMLSGVYSGKRMLLIKRPEDFAVSPECAAFYSKQICSLSANCFSF